MIDLQGKVKEVQGKVKDLCERPASVTPCPLPTSTLLKAVFGELLVQDMWFGLAERALVQTCTYLILPTSSGADLLFSLAFDTW